MSEQTADKHVELAADDLLQAVHRFHQTAQLWHGGGPERPGATDTVEAKVLHLHAMNFDLWHYEDAVRRPGVDAHEVVRRKRAIDGLNAGRNAAIEDIDVTLLARLAQNRWAPLHTETPGTIVDRLSVLSLRILHTPQAPQPSPRRPVLEEQYDDLLGGLGRLLAHIREGEIRFKVYRQFKSAGQRSDCALFDTRDR